MRLVDSRECGSIKNCTHCAPGAAESVLEHLDTVWTPGTSVYHWTGSHRPTLLDTLSRRNRAVTPLPGTYVAVSRMEPDPFTTTIRLTTVTVFASDPLGGNQPPRAPAWQIVSPLDALVVARTALAVPGVARWPAGAGSWKPPHPRQQAGTAQNAYIGAVASRRTIQEMVTLLDEALQQVYGASTDVPVLDPAFDLDTIVRRCHTIGYRRGMWAG